jgi:hypothetical protein
LGLYFICAGAHAGQPGTLATLQENKTQLGRIVRSFSSSLEDKGVHVMKPPAGATSGTVGGTYGTDRP